MAEYITREAAYEKCGWYNTVNGKSVCAARKDELAAIPAADVAPVVHARWVKDGDFLICLNCESEMNVKNSLGVENRKNYCPNCGARMDGE